MSLAMEHERDNVFRMDLFGTLKKADFDRCQQRLATEMARIGPVRLLIILNGFAGWDPDAPWNDLSFYMLMFAGAGLRQAPVEYFPPGTASEARAWLQS